MPILLNGERVTAGEEEAQLPKEKLVRFKSVRNWSLITTVLGFQGNPEDVPAKKVKGDLLYIFAMIKKYGSVTLTMTDQGINIIPKSK